MVPSPFTSWQIDGVKVETVADFAFLGPQIIVESYCRCRIKGHLLLERKAMTNLDSILKKQRHCYANKGAYSQSCGFPVVMYGCESWTIQKVKPWRICTFNLWFWKRLLRLPWTTRISKQSILKEISSIIIRQAEAEAPILSPPDANRWFIGKYPDAGKDWVQEEKGATENEMVVWHHWLNGDEFEQAPGDSEEQGSLVSCSPWGHKK